MVASPPPTVFAPLEPLLAHGSTATHCAERLCAQTRAHLHEFVDNELDLRDASERALHDAVHRHLLVCTKCARLEAQLRAMRLALAAVGARSMQRERVSASLLSRATQLLRTHARVPMPSPVPAVAPSPSPSNASTRASTHASAHAAARDTPHGLRLVD